MVAKKRINNRDKEIHPFFVDEMSSHGHQPTFLATAKVENICKFKPESFIFFSQKLPVRSIKR
jgi:hypothetical protein